MIAARRSPRRSGARSSSGVGVGGGGEYDAVVESDLVEPQTVAVDVEPVLGSEFDDALLACAHRPRLCVFCFCAFHGQEVVLLHHGYNKRQDTSPRRQRREIAKARKIHNEWKRRTH